MNRQLRLQREDGASLLLALAMILFISVSGIALLTLTGVSSKNSTVARSQTKQLYAADGGIETGIRSLQTDTTNQFCQSIGSSFQTVATATINGKPVTVSCKTTVGGSSTSTTTTTGNGGVPSILDGGYTALLGTGGLTIAGNGNNATGVTGSFLVNGDAYSGGPISAPSTIPLTIDGKLDYYQACPPPPTNVTVSPCALRASGPTTPVPAVVVPTTAAPAPVANGANCTILYPGKYTSLPTLNVSSNYLASGTYYFENTGDFNLSGTIFGGAPGVEAKQMSSSPCATDAQADTLSTTYDATKAGSGVEIILGGNATLRAQSGAYVELYSRVPATTSPDAAAKPGLSVWARATAQTSYIGVNQATVFLTQDKASTVVVHGTVYLPDSLANIREPLNALANKAPIFMGGILAKGLTVDMQGNSQASWVGTLTGQKSVTTTTTTDDPRTTLVCATAASTDGGAATLVEAATLPDTTDPTQVIKSWREVNAC